MRRTLLHLHAYLGLLAAPYLLILGLSCFHFNHHDPDAQHLGEARLRAPLPHSLAPAAVRGRPRAEALLDSLQLMGWHLPWTMREDSLHYRIRVVHPGQEYDLLDTLGTVQVTARRRDLLSLFGGLHGMGEAIPRAPLPLRIWPWYLELSVYALLFWVVTGLYLWWGTKRNRRREGPVLLIAFSLSVLLMLYLWLIG